MSFNVSKHTPLVLYNTRALTQNKNKKVPKGLHPNNFANGDDDYFNQIMDHCKVKYPHKVFGQHTERELFTAKKELKDFRERINTACVDKWRSIILTNLRNQNVNYGSIGEISAHLNGENSNLALCRQVFLACFTWINEEKTTLVNSIASAVILENDIRFHCAATENEKVACIAALADEAVHTARKPFMKGGNRSNVVTMSTKIRDGDWGGRVSPAVGSNMFSYDKINGWLHLIKCDPMARSIYKQHIGEKPVMSSYVANSPTEDASSPDQQVKLQTLLNETPFLLTDQAVYGHSSVGGHAKKEYPGFQNAASFVASTGNFVASTAQREEHSDTIGHQQQTVARNDVVDVDVVEVSGVTPYSQHAADLSVFTDSGSEVRPDPIP